MNSSMIWVTPGPGSSGTGSRSGCGRRGSRRPWCTRSSRPGELACRITDREGEFLSESSVCRILKVADPIESPAYILLQAADRFDHPTQAHNELWQTDFPYLPVVGWGW